MFSVFKGNVTFFGFYRNIVAESKSIIMFNIRVFNKQVCCDVYAYSFVKIARMHTYAAYGKFVLVSGKVEESCGVFVIKFWNNKFFITDKGGRFRRAFIKNGAVMAIGFVVVAGIRSGFKTFGASAGKIRYTGISLYSSDDYFEVAKSGFDAVQIPLNIFDWKQIDSGGIKALAESGMMIFVRSVFLQGLAFFSPEDVDPRMDFCIPYLEKFILILVFYLIRSLNSISYDLSCH